MLRYQDVFMLKLLRPHRRCGHLDSSGGHKQTLSPTLWRPVETLVPLATIIFNIYANLHLHAILDSKLSLCEAESACGDGAVQESTGLFCSEASVDLLQLSLRFQPPVMNPSTQSCALSSIIITELEPSRSDKRRLFWVLSISR